MADPQLGDTVKVIDKGAACYAETGTVRTVEETIRKVNGVVQSNHTVYDVLFPHRGNGPIHYHAHQLQEVE